MLTIIQVCQYVLPLVCNFDRSRKEHYIESLYWLHLQQTTFTVTWMRTEPFIRHGTRSHMREQVLVTTHVIERKCQTNTGSCIWLLDEQAPGAALGGFWSFQKPLLV